VGGDPTVHRMDVGSFQLDVVRDGEFWLDGGAMFGVVPRVVWEKLSPPDDANRIRLQTNCLLIRGGGKTVLVDTGVGAKEDDRFYEMFRVDRGTDLTESLAAVGVEAGEVDFVVNSHLHWDHAGGNTRRDSGGELVPTFPNAKYVTQEGEWREAVEATERTKASYRPDNFLPLEAAGCLRFVDGSEEIVPGVSVFPLPGHNRFMQAVKVESEGSAAVYLADLVPTRHHLRLPYIMGYDLFPATTLESKRRILPMAAAGGWLIAFDHDPELPLATLTRDAKGNFQAVAPRTGGG